MNALKNVVRNNPAVAQVSNLPYRRFPIGERSVNPESRVRFLGRRVGNPRYSRLETCATAFWRFLVGGGYVNPESRVRFLGTRVGNPRYSRLETCATRHSRLETCATGSERLPRAIL
jgi:hypothetical protein